MINRKCQFCDDIRDESNTCKECRHNPNFSLEDLEFEGTFEVKYKFKVTHYIPAREAPACSNPSDPAFSDPGDSEEFEFDLYYLDDEGNMHYAPDYHYELLYGQILAMYKEEIDG